MEAGKCKGGRNRQHVGRGRTTSDWGKSHAAEERDVLEALFRDCTTTDGRTWSKKTNSEIKGFFWGNSVLAADAAIQRRGPGANSNRKSKMNNAEVSVGGKNARPLKKS